MHRFYKHSYFLFFVDLLSSITFGWQQYNHHWWHLEDCSTLSSACITITEFMTPLSKSKTHLCVLNCFTICSIFNRNWFVTVSLFIISGTCFFLLLKCQVTDHIPVQSTGPLGRIQTHTWRLTSQGLDHSASGTAEKKINKCVYASSYQHHSYSAHVNAKFDCSSSAN